MTLRDRQALAERHGVVYKFRTECACGLVFKCISATSQRANELAHQRQCGQRMHTDAIGRRTAPPAAGSSSSARAAPTRREA